MNVETYIENQIAELEAELSDKRVEFASCIQPADWDAFSTSAAKKLNKAYESFCSAIRWRVTWGWFAGTSSIQMGSRTQTYFLKHGAFRLVAAVEQAAFVRFPAPGDPTDSIYDYPQLTLSANKVRLIQAYLSLDFDQTSPLSVCYGDYVESTRIVEARIPGTDKQMDISSITEKALLKQGKVLSSLLSEFELIAHAVLRSDRLKERMSSLERQMRILKSSKKAFQQVHIPIDQMTEVIEQLERLAGSAQLAAALLLKGPSGTGKTLLAEKIAEGGMFPFIKAGVNTLKKPNLGESAAAVQGLWRNVRANKPCILFIDECDSIFGQRGSANTDTISQEITNAFLAEWDGREAGIWVIGTTNRRNFIDDAILSRFGVELEIAHPDKECRAAILLQELQAAGYSGSLPENAARLTQGMSGRDLAMLALRFAAKRPSDFASVVRQVRSAANPHVDEHASWDALILSEDTKSSLQTTCALLKDTEGWATRGVSIPNGILLEGPAGTGKTQIGRTIANEGGLGFVKATAADLKGLYLGHAAANVRDIFEKARAVSPAVLFLDELDIVAPRRNGGGTNDALAGEMVGQMLQEMDGIVAQRRPVFVLAATNHPENVDQAILSRFTERIHIPLPNLRGRISILKLMLDNAKMKRALSEEESHTLGQLSEGMSGRDLKNWVSLAQRRAVRRAIAAGGPDQYSLTMDDLLNIIPSIPHPSTAPIP